MERNIAGIKSVYSVTDTGEVWYTKGSERHRVTTYYNAKGYEQVHVYRTNGDMLTTTVHRLVALAFIPLVDGKTQVNHIDTCKRNNCVNNLEWVNQAENMQHAVAHGIYTKERNVYQYTPDFRLVAVYSSASEAMCYNDDLTYSDISKCLSSATDRNFASGYFWYSALLTSVPVRSKHARTFMPIQVYKAEKLIGIYADITELMQQFPEFTSKGALATCLSKGKQYKGYTLRRLPVPSAVVNE